MDYQEAKKLVAKQKAKEDGFLQVEFDYGKKLVFPHKIGVAFVEALGQAEVLEGRYSDDVPRFVPVNSEIGSIAFMSRAEYQDRKMAELLNVSLATLRDLQKQESNKPT